MKTTPVLLAVLLFAACNSNPAVEKKKSVTEPADHAATQPDPHFRAFLRKFRVMQLPLTIRPMELGNVDNLPLLYGRDTNYIEAPGTDTALYRLLAYGLLADTAGSYKVIWLSPADDYWPIKMLHFKSRTIHSESRMIQSVADITL